ncbi:MAG: hypothetical protein IPO08_20620 [Xanthomonadales bacterium]|nr:hypothetical protein [Xanthomonadales bacterium]
MTNRTAHNENKANRRLEYTLSRCGKGLNSVRKSNILGVAQTEAFKAFAEGETYPYPRKRYPKLEQLMGVLIAVELTCFNEAYTAYLEWEVEVNNR